jgi:hypothetical protein
VSAARKNIAGVNGPRMPLRSNRRQESCATPKVEMSGRLAAGELVSASGEQEIVCPGLGEGKARAVSIRQI